MMNKKASGFEVALVLIAFVSLSYAFGSFVFVKEKIKNEMSPDSEIMKMYGEKAKEEFYEKELLSLKAQQKFYEIAKEGAILEGDCNIRSAEYMEWNANCMPNAEMLKKEFVSEIKKNNVKTGREEKYVKCSVEYSYDSSASINLEKIGIYPEEFATMNELADSCKNDGNIGECVKMKRWNVETKKESGYVLFDLSTKKNFFFNGKFEPIILKFAIKE